MSLKNDQYDWRGTRTAWRHWKKKLKAWTSRKFRHVAKDVEREVPGRRTGGWVR